MSENYLTNFISRLLTGFLLAIMSINIFASQQIPANTTALKNTDCIQCHEKTNSTLIKDWQSSAHASTESVINCVSCHGQLHKNMASKARRDETCINCHGGKKDPVAHSYASSKHGILMRLEKNTYDWSQPFELANYRAPGCGYCHMHNNKHNVSNTVRHNLMTDDEVEKVQDNTRAVCQDCHAPRYITRLFENGEAMLEIARKKVREAKTIITRAEKIFNAQQLSTAKQQFKKMQQHLKNVHLGIGHQSPDYQWWHGQPALDGDLLRIKDSIGELQRLKSINTKH